jgi:hypothetical protein
LQKKTELVALHHPNIVSCFGLYIEKNFLVFALSSKKITVDGICHSINWLRHLVDTPKFTPARIEVLLFLL